MKKSFKEILNKPYSEMDANDLLRLMADEDAMKDLLLNTRKISEEVLAENKDPFIRKQFTPILSEVILLDEEREIGRFFKENENDPEGILEFLKGKILSRDYHSVLPAAHVFMALETRDKICEFKDQIQSAIEDCISELKEMKVENSYHVLCNFLDLIHEIRQSYYEIMSEDILSSTKELNEIVERLTEFTSPLYEEVMKELAEQMKDVTPEDIGVLDVTKLKENDENGI